MCAMEIENRHCIVWFKDNRWSFFTNEFWLTPKEAKDYGERNSFKKSTPWKVVLYDKQYRI
jgi:hypothetical protein